MTDNAAPANIAFDPTGRIAQDISCIHCGYNLRTLSPEQVCPECGSKIDLTLRGSLWGASPAWIATTIRGLSLLAASMAIVLLYTCVAPPLLMAFSPFTVIWLYSRQGLSWVALAILPGVWLATTPQQPKPQDGSTARRIARLGLAIGLSVWPLTSLLGTYRAGMPYLLQSLLLGAPGILPFLSSNLTVLTVMGRTVRLPPILGMICIIIGCGALLVYARQVARLIPHKGLARQTTYLLWELMIVQIPTAALAIVSRPALVYSTSGSQSMMIQAIPYALMGAMILNALLGLRVIILALQYRRHLRAVRQSIASADHQRQVSP